MSPSGRAAVRHVFVLMLENRSFDHMLGYSAIQGTDAETGKQTTISHLTGAEFNMVGVRRVCVSQKNAFLMKADPGHEFENVVKQLCGPDATYSGGKYPAVDNSGFAASYADSTKRDPHELMECYPPARLPIVNALANEFAICDHWYASMPGPTWPNRLFSHGASSGGLDHSPSIFSIVAWELWDGFSFPNGSVFDALNDRIRWRIYSGDFLPVVAALKGIHLRDARQYKTFTNDISDERYPATYTLIEPRYEFLASYSRGNSQHPLNDVRCAEILIKETYEALRGSPLWQSSVLVITWDEHGGFYDHERPPAAVAPGDTAPNSKYNKHGFTFEQYGPRVPALVISPFVPRNVIDHRCYDHASIPATVMDSVGLPRLRTARGVGARSVLGLLTLPRPRTDAPLKLPDLPNGPDMPECGDRDWMAKAALSEPEAPIDENVPGFLLGALRFATDLSPKNAIELRNQFAGLKTRAQAYAFVESVRTQIMAAGA